MPKPLPALFIAISITLAGCTPEVGSERWCQRMQEKPKGDWSINEAGDYAKNCLLKQSGSASWCQQMQEKPKGDWSVNEAADYAKDCLINQR